MIITITANGLLIVGVAIFLISSLLDTSGSWGELSTQKKVCYNIASALCLCAGVLYLYELIF